MPSERYPHINLPYILQENISGQPQAKLCSFCLATLVDPSTASFQDSQVICALCRDRPHPPLTQPSESRQSRINQDNVPYPLWQISHEAPVLQHGTRWSQASLDTAATPHSETPPAYHPSPPKGSSTPNVHCSTVVPIVSTQRTLRALTYATDDNRLPIRSSRAAFLLDPYIDITHVRIRSQPHQCLYPGSIFQGTQKSGRNSYDVHVTIVDVNFAASTLCGYLKICGLTDDWPELTTYFDAEIIGNRYGFLTQNWGATRNEDLIHWSRFSAFKSIRQETKHPHMTIDNTNRGVVFMRWKERFLVPNHRVQDINGASFAGFYYVCVDFNPPAQPSSAPNTSVSNPAAQDTTSGRGVCPPIISNIDSSQCNRRKSSRSWRNASLSSKSPPMATMNGFYYHQNSEPYQQLSLVHVPEQTSSSFEFR